MKPFLALQNKPFPQVFSQILDYHLEDNSKILDPTPGEGHSWEWYNNKKENGFFKTKKYSIIISLLDIKDIPINGKFDGIFFDPPFIFGLDKTKDKRDDDYGKYCHSFKDICNIISDGNKKFPNILQDDGKLFFKYTDVFSLKERKYYYCAGEWFTRMSNFKVIDHYIIQHHHITGTAWQVKNRPCGIVNYTYLTVLQKL
jgi:hypothetical protein